VSDPLFVAPLFVAKGIAKSFGKTTVLRGVDLAVRAGEVHAVLGENGAGKSTLMRILLGLETADAGTMRLAGEPYAPRGSAEARGRGVVIVPQERTLCGSLSVEENIVLGIEPANAFGLIRARERRALAERALAQIAARISPVERTSVLSVADQQLVEIARALVRGSSARLLVLDEPTSSLGQDDANRLFARIRALAEGGLAVILVTHFLSDVRDHADRYTVLRDGKVCGEGDPRTTPMETIVHAMIGRELAPSIEAHRAPPGEKLLEVAGVAGASKPSQASFVVRRGEILGIAGLVGSGRTELLRAVVGLDPIRAGSVHVSAARGVGLLSEDRGGEGLMLERSIGDNVALTSGGAFLVSPRAVAANATRWIERLAIRAFGADQRAGELSGGNQQKVQIARLLREDYDVLLVDEPTRGIDVASRAQVLALLRELADGGKGLVLVSSQLDELLATCDRIAVLKRGTLGEFRPTSDWTEPSLLLEMAS
jgi:ribose transport system ATP-binding protein